VPVFNVNPGGVLFLAHVQEEDGHAELEGGAIFNRGTVYLYDSRLVRNTVGRGDAGLGGAIANHGTLFVLKSDLFLNSAASGGAIANFGNGNAVVSGSLLGFNKAPGGVGGAIYNAGRLTVAKSGLSECCERRTWRRFTQ